MKKWALHFLISGIIISTPDRSLAMINYLPGARMAALAQATVALPGTESLFYNPAGISREVSMSVFLSYENRYLLKELSLLSAGCILPIRTGTFGICYYRSGTAFCNESKIGMAFSRAWGKRFSAALRFDLLSERMPENPYPAYGMTVALGILHFIPGKMTYGIYLHNPVASRMQIPGEERRIPLTVSAGHTWLVNSSLRVCGEIQKTLDEPLHLKTALEFTPGSEVAIRAGVSSAPLKFSLGAGFRMEHLHFDIAFSPHDILGLTPTAGITWIP